MVKRVQIGDVFSVKGTEHYGYIQYVYKDVEYGNLIRKISGKHVNKCLPQKLDNLINLPTDFYFFFPLQSVYNASEKKQKTEDGNLIELTMHRGISVPAADKVPQLIEGHPGRWSVRVNGEDRFLGDSLPEKYIGNSSVEFYNYESLVYAIETDYKSIDDLMFKKLKKKKPSNKTGALLNFFKKMEE